jgi:type II restriction enzyme
MNNFISQASDLVTNHEQTRQGFLEIALEKNKQADPYVDQAKALFHELLAANVPSDILDLSTIRPAVLAASGLSTKALKYLTSEDKNDAIEQLITKVLEPAGDKFRDELVYRFLLIRGDALGGRMRNIVGHIAQRRLIKRIASYVDTLGLDFKWFSNKTKNWITTDLLELDASDVKAFWWRVEGNDYVLAFNLNIPIVKKNVDINLFKATPETYGTGSEIVSDIDSMIMFGELKGGIDPAGADEHWKTANTALERIRDSFSNINISIKTSFVGAAIESAMATEIFDQLSKGIITNAANLYKDDQLSEYAKWIVGGAQDD